MAASLWDIYDYSNENNDTLSDETKLWNAFYSNDAQTIFEFEADWNALSYDSLDLNFDHNNIRKYVDSTDPQIEITNPINRYATANTAITVRGTSSDNIGVITITIYVNDVVTSTLTNNLDNWSILTSLHSSSNTIKAIAEDAEGNTAEDFIYVFYDDDNNDNMGGTEKITNLTIFEDPTNTFENWNRFGTNWINISDTNQNGITDVIFQASNCDDDDPNSECILDLKNGLNLTSFATAYLDFSYRLVGIDDSQNEGLEIKVSDNGGIWNQVSQYTEIHADDERFGITWSNDNVDLSSHVSSDNLTLSFTAINSKRNEFVYINDIRIYGDLKTNSTFEILNLTISSSNSNNLYAKTMDNVTVYLQTDKPIHDVNMTIQNHTVVPYINNNTLIANLTISENDTNGNMTFNIILTDVQTATQITELNLTSSNVFIDTMPPIITSYASTCLNTPSLNPDSDASVSDNDPAYNGTIFASVYTDSTTYRTIDRGSSSSLFGGTYSVLYSKTSILIIEIFCHSFRYIPSYIGSSSIINMVGFRI